MKQNFNIDGELKITLREYIHMEHAVSQGKKTTARYRKRVEEVMEASKELSSFLSFLSKKVDNFDGFVSAFNSETTSCEIQKTEDNNYKIKLNLDNEEQEDRS